MTNPADVVPICSGGIDKSRRCPSHLLRRDWQIPARICQSEPSVQLTLQYDRKMERCQKMKHRKQYISIILRRAKPGKGSLNSFIREKHTTLSVFNLKNIFIRTPFVITGGIATRLYMQERMTLDLDIVVLSEDSADAERELKKAGCVRKGILSIGGSTWILPDKTDLDMIVLTKSWAEEAIRHPRTGPDGLPYIDLPYLVLMKLRSSRAQDIADISRMMGNAEEKSAKKTKQVVGRHFPDDLEDLESLIYLGKLEMSSE